jgi:predicted transcriptional regulator
MGALRLWLAGAMVCWHPMRRTTVKLPDDLDARLRHEAERRGVTIADVTRTALEQHLGAGGRRKFKAAAASRSGHSDVSERIEEILASEIAPSR